MAKLKLFLILATTMSTMLACARPSPGDHGPRPLPMHGPRIQYAPPPPKLAPRHHHHHSASSFWTGVGVGLLGSLIAPPPPPPPTVIVTTPTPTPAPVVVQPARVWVPPVYGERPIYRAGIYVGIERYIITPGYWR